MSQTVSSGAHVEHLIECLDGAVESDCSEEICDCVKNALIEMIASGEERLPESFLKPTEGQYARRLLHKDPAGRYSVVVMVWDVGQGTALHDHAGQWCVEAVYRGNIRVTSYDLEEKVSDELHKFSEQNTIEAGVGQAGALIPPYEYHILENASDSEPAVTIHVYSTELTWSNAFFPAENGLHRKERKELSYSA